MASIGLALLALTIIVIIIIIVVIVVSFSQTSNILPPPPTTSRNGSSSGMTLTIADGPVTVLGGSKQPLATIANPRRTITAFNATLQNSSKIPAGPESSISLFDGPSYKDTLLATVSTTSSSSMVVSTPLTSQPTNSTLSVWAIGVAETNTGTASAIQLQLS